MTRGFQARAGEAADEIQSTADLIVDTCEIGRGDAQDLTPEEAEAIRSAMGNAALDNVRDYLLATDHIHVSWRTDDHYLHGEFFLKDLRTCLAGNYIPYVDPRLPQEEQLVMEELKTLEEAPGSGRLTALRVPPYAESREMWFYDTNHRRLKLLDLDFKAYLETLLVTKGIPGWQYLFTDTDMGHREFHAIVRQLRISLESLAEMFPGHDYSDLHARLEARL